MAIQEQAMKHYTLDTPSDMLPSLIGPAVVSVISTGDVFFVRNGVYSQTFLSSDLDSAAIGAGFSGFTDFMTQMAYLNTHAVTNA